MFYTLILFARVEYGRSCDVVTHLISNLIANGSIELLSGNGNSNQNFSISRMCYGMCEYVVTYIVNMYYSN